MSMNTSTFNNKKDPFSQLSNEWWDENGRFQSLHKFTDIRIQYINRIVSKYKKPNKTYSLNKLKCLDIGCGGGLLSERIARLGASVTGIDITKSSIEIAKMHAFSSGLNINYLNTDVSSFIKKNKVDPGSNPWGGMSLEWTHTSSPPHPHNFEEEPVLQHGPYDYDKVIVEKTYKK